MKSAIDALHERAIAWVRAAAPEDLMELPAEMLGLNGTVESVSRRRLPRKVSRELGRDEADDVRKRLTALSTGSADYNKVRDDLCRKYGVTRRQIAAAVAVYRSWQARKSAKR